MGLNHDIISGGLSKQYLVLPRDGDTARDKLVVKVIVCGVEVHAFDGGELLDVQDVFTIHGARLGDIKTAVRSGVQMKKDTEQQ